MAKSPDAFRTISEVAEWLGVQAHVLRFWESKFNQVKPIKRAGGRRYYRPTDMLLIGGIKKLLHDDGLTIKGVQKILRENGTAYVSDHSQPLDDLTVMVLDAADDDVRDAAETPAEMDVFAGETEDTAELPAFESDDDAAGEVAAAAPADPIEADQTAPVGPEDLGTADAGEHSDAEDTAAHEARAENQAHDVSELDDASGMTLTPEDTDISAEPSLEDDATTEYLTEASVAPHLADDALPDGVLPEDTPEPNLEPLDMSDVEASDAVTAGYSKSEESDALKDQELGDPIADAEDTVSAEAPTEKAAAEGIPSFRHRSAAPEETPAVDNPPAEDTEKTEAAPEPVPQQPRVLDLPPLPVEADLPAERAALSAVARVTALTPEQADDLRPVLAELVQLRDQMARPGAGGPKD